MKREARDKREHMPRPVRRIPLEEKPSRRRVVGFAIAAAAACLALFFAIRALVRVDAGWTWVDLSNSDGPVCDVRLWADLGAGTDSPLTERRFLTDVCSTASREFYTLMNPYEIASGEHNLWWINHHPNEIIEVDPRLYNALKQSVSAGRWVFLGPVYEIWDGVYFSTGDQDARQGDPRLDAETGEALREIMEQLRREDRISLDFLEDSRLRLNLAPELMELGETYEITRYLDFGWMTNAYAADYLADTLLEKGWTHGLLVSSDGFVRCLDDRGSYSLEILSTLEGRNILAANAVYEGPAALLQLIPRPQGDRPRSFVYADGGLRTPWISPEDGLDRRPVDSLTAVSRDGGCADLLNQVIPLLTADDFSPDALIRLAGEMNGELTAVVGEEIFQAGDTAMLRIAEN